MGEILGGKCNCGFQVSDLFVGSGEIQGSFLAPHVCRKCKKVFSVQVKLRRQLSETSGQVEEVKHACPECNETNTEGLNLDFYETNRHPRMKRFKLNLRRRILDSTSLLPSAWQRKAYWFLHRNTYFLNTPVYIAHCPNCHKHRLKFYSGGNWD